MIVALGMDHAGFSFKKVVEEAVQAAGHSLLDLGTDSETSVDYPDYAEAVGDAVAGGKADLGILVCGSGVGTCIAANKIPGVRAALCHDAFSARQSREDDDANVLCLGSRVIGPNLAQDLIRIFLSARFSEAERHRRRLAKVARLEKRLPG